MINGANGHAVPPPAAGPAIELLERVASFKTALVALLAMVKREGGWRSTEDQMLVRECERLVERDEEPEPEET